MTPLNARAETADAKAADQWLETSEATGLVVALAAFPEWGRNQLARDLLRRAYLAGLERADRELK